MSWLEKLWRSARHNLAGWQRTIAIKTAAGGLTLKTDDGSLELIEGESAGPADFVMLYREPQLPVDWMSFKEFTTILKLDRLPRSVRRNQQKGG